MDPWSTWDQERREREEQQRAQDELDRQSIALLLEARGHGKVAVLVAGSEYRCVLIDNYDGGQYKGEFAVPPGWYDHIDEQTRAALEDATRAVVGEAHFAGVNITIRRAALAPGWEEAMVRRIVESASAGQDPGPLLALLPAPAIGDAANAHGGGEERNSPRVETGPTEERM